MGSDAIANARVCGSNKNSSKKKRGSKQRKSKQNKVDDSHVTREPRLSRVDNEHNAEKSNAGVELPQPILKGCEEDKIQGNEAASGRKHENEIPTSGRKHENEIPTSGRKHENEVLTTYNNEAVSRTNGLIVRRLDHNDLSKDFCGSRNSCSGGSCLSSDGDDRCLDDWEAVADALTVENNRQTSDLEHHASETKSSGANCQYQRNSRAWSRNDVYRPRSLPGLPKQRYNQNQLNSEHCFSSGPSACPICCEDFDVTDLSFLPCPCGFQLCLFCHKRILEADGRCPGCRKQYDSVKGGAALAVETTRACSKNTWF